MKRTIYLLAMALIFGTFLLGCPPKKVVPPSEEITEPETKPGEAEGTEGKEGDEAMEIEEDKVTGMEDITRKTPEEELKEVMGGVDDIYFDYDRYEIKKEAQEKLSKLADLLTSGSGSVVIEGHCDDRGTNEYNLALGDRRASAAKDFLVASGVSPNKLNTISYGEERPLCAQQAESCWSKNRRAHFRVSGIDQ